jgi:hypothetical protein
MSDSNLQYRFSPLNFDFILVSLLSLKSLLNNIEICTYLLYSTLYTNLLNLQCYKIEWNLTFLCSYYYHFPTSFIHTKTSILNILVYTLLFHLIKYFWQCWCLNSEPHTCSVSALPHEALCQPNNVLEISSYLYPQLFTVPSQKLPSNPHGNTPYFIHSVC